MYICVSIYMYIYIYIYICTHITGVCNIMIMISYHITSYHVISSYMVPREQGIEYGNVITVGHNLTEFKARGAYLKMIIIILIITR